MKTSTPVTETLLGMWQISSSGIFSNSWEDGIVAFWGLSQNVVVITNIIKEPWDTPQRATPKSCYLCQKNPKKTQNIKKISKNNWKKQSTHSKTNSKKKTPKNKQEKTEQIPHKKTNKNWNIQKQKQKMNEKNEKHKKKQNNFKKKTENATHNQNKDAKKEQKKSEKIE